MTGLRGLLAIITLGLAISAGPASAAADYAREQRWADETLPAVLVGDPVYLTQANGHRFLGLLAQADDPPMGLVIVHGMGIHPDWGMVSTLRQALFDEGYTTLSIQMPILAADAGPDAYPALFPEAAERLALAVAYLQAKGHRRVAIVSHSQGSRMTRHYMAGNPSAVAAWAAISLTQGDAFDGIAAPILDLYGSDDLPHVLAATDRRRKSLANPVSRQQVIADADHFFAGHEAAMVEAVKAFLDGVGAPAPARLSELMGPDPRPLCPGWD